MFRIRNAQRCAILCAATSLLLTVIVINPALARYAALVVDAETRTVLFSRNADDRNYPASLTKIMTLYLTFEALEEGEITLDTRLKVSRRAAGQAPSKLGLKPGSTIRVEDAILALVTKSANDVATVVAEGLGGSEIKFARMMTAKAHKLGMEDTTFRNASGLPNRAQVSTARDMVTLALAIQRDFPQYYHYFSTPSFTYKGRSYRNHNNLLGRYEGTDGIKTGYIRASGFNLVAAVERDGQRLIGVVFGGRTAATRDAHMRSILDKSFVRLAEMKTPPVPVAMKPEPPRHLAQAELPPKPLAKVAMVLNEPAQPSAKPDPELAAVEDPLADDADAELLQAAVERPASVVAASLVAESAAPAPTVARSASGKNMLRLTAMKQPPDEIASKLVAAEATAEELAATDMGTAGTWAAQVGAFQHYASARKRLQRSTGLLPDQFKYRGTAIEPTLEDGQKLFRARLIGLSEEDARHVCVLLKREQIGCLPVGPEQIAAAPRPKES